MKDCRRCSVPLVGRGPQAKYCIACAKLVQREQTIAWVNANPERNAECARAARAANRDRINELARARRAKDRTPDREQLKKWRKANPEKSTAYSIKWRNMNRDSFRLARRVWAHNRRSAPGKLTKPDSVFLLAQPCAYCGAPSEHIEHCTPVSRGGHNDVANCVGACASCNLRKNTKTVLEFTGLWPTGI